ncbi:ATP-dependent DNA helicase [Trichonephila clavipes]|nr:ATP-dependent DNA helicase [Trichonephila clavipes]
MRHIDQSQARRLQQATYMASHRHKETIEAAESRKRAVADRAQQRRLIFTRNTCVGFCPTFTIQGQICHTIGSLLPTTYTQPKFLPDDTTSYPVEFLNSLELSGVPSHKLELKVGVPVLLMRNLDAPKLCNELARRNLRTGRPRVGHPCYVVSKNGGHIECGLSHREAECL